MVVRVQRLVLAAAPAEQLERAVRESELSVYTGKDDRLLRRLAMRADFGLDVPEDLRGALGELVGAEVSLTLTIRDPARDSRFRVDAPADARPWSELGAR